MEKHEEESRVAIVGIIVQDKDDIDELNHVLHEYGEFIIGRMGIPYQEKKICIISIALDAPQSIISELSGKVGMIKGISAKVTYAKY